MPIRFSFALVVGALSMLLMGCASNGSPAEVKPPLELPEESPLAVTVQWNETRQVIRGFGASGAWSTRFVGAHWPEAKKNKMADWLFSRDTTEGGKPKGIGLSIWRFNIGAGSAAQGAASGIRDPWRRTEGFLQDDGTYDWSRQQGQQWFMRAAQKRGVPTIIGFANSPPVEYTLNGKAYGDGGGTANLPDDRFDDYAQFLAHVVEHFKREGMPFDYISPVNEPQWNWSQDNNQEGSPYTNAEIKRIVGLLNQELSSRGLSTQIEIPEAARTDFLHSVNADYPKRSNQLSYFFGSEGVGHLSKVANKAAGHSYFTTWPVSKLVRQREQLAQQIQAMDSSLEYWMSEYCILADNKEIQGAGRDLGIEPALYVARVIHADLTVANASSWQWWLGVSPYDFKDGLIYIEKNKYNGDLHDSKLLWGLGNYSRFLQPGAVRVAVRRSDRATAVQAAEGLMVSAYRAADAENVVVVAVNQEQRARELRLQVEGKDGTISTWQPYVTSRSKNLAPSSEQSGEQTFSVPARSIVTYVGAQ